MSASALIRKIGDISAWTGLLLVLLVSTNVLGRYLFSFSSVALQELEWHAMAAIALLGMSYGINQGAEVRVDILYCRFSVRKQALIDLISSCLMCAVSLVIAWLSIDFFTNSYSINEGSPDPGGLGYRYLLKALIPIAFILLAIQSTCMIADSFRRLTSA